MYRLYKRIPNCSLIFSSLENFFFYVVYDLNVLNINNNPSAKTLINLKYRFKYLSNCMLFICSERFSTWELLQLIISIQLKLIFYRPCILNFHCWQNIRHFGWGKKGISGARKRVCEPQEGINLNTVLHLPLGFLIRHFLQIRNFEF